MRRMWKDIRALQRFTVNRGLVKWVVEEAVEGEVTDEMVERVAEQTEGVVLGRMQSNSMISAESGNMELLPRNRLSRRGSYGRL